MGRSRSELAALGLVFPPAAFFIFFLLHPLSEPLLQPDSNSYLIFSPFRTGGYPFFLSTLKSLAGEASGYVPIQLGLYAVAVLILGHVIWRHLDTLVAALLAEIALLFNPLVNAVHFTILTDSLFISTMVLFLAACLSALCSRGHAGLAIASLLAGIAVTIRPTGIALLPALAVLALILLHRHGLWRVALAATLPCIVAMALEATYYHLHHDKRESLLPIHIFARGGMVSLDNPAAIIARAPAERRVLDQALETDLAKVRALIAGAPNRAAVCRLIDGYEVYVQYRFMTSINADTPVLRSLQAQQDAGLARIIAAPLSYIAITFQHWRCLWTVWAASAEDKAAFRSYLEQNAPIPFIPEIIEELRPGDSLPFIRIAVIGMWCLATFTALAGLVALAAILWPGISRTMVLAGLAGLSVHAGFALTAASGVSIPRYAFDFWPALVIGGGLASWALMLGILSKRTP